MMRENKRVTGEIFAWHLAGVAGAMPFVNAKLNPRQINPYRKRNRAVERKIEEVRAFINSMGLAAAGRR